MLNKCCKLIFSLWFRTKINFDLMILSCVSLVLQTSQEKVWLQKGKCKIRMWVVVRVSVSNIDRYFSPVLQRWRAFPKFWRILNLRGYLLWLLGQTFLGVGVFWDIMDKMAFVTFFICHLSLSHFHKWSQTFCFEAFSSNGKLKWSFWYNKLRFFITPLLRVCIIFQNDCRTKSHAILHDSTHTS